MVIRPYVLATGAVLPLLAPEVWNGVRLGLSDPVLGVLAPTEQPLSVRTPVGLWAMGLAVAWFGLVYWRRRCAWWEAGLVLLGGTAALLRLGNAWVDAVAMVLPLAHQIGAAKLSPTVARTSLAVCLAVTGLMVWTTRPPDLPVGAAQALMDTNVRGIVLADWRWAPGLQRQLGAGDQVLAAGGLTSEPPDFWLDYLRIAEGHERWAALLEQRNVNLLILDSSNQQRQVAGFVRASSDWRVLYDADGALVAERVSTPDARAAGKRDSPTEARAVATRGSTSEARAVARRGST